MQKYNSSSPYYERPPTPQALQHQAPTTKSTDNSSIPQKYIVLIQAPMYVAGKVQIASQVSERLSCPLFQSDSLHESCAKAATVGKSQDNGQARYRRM